MKNVPIYITLFLALFALNVFSQIKTNQQALNDMAEREAIEYNKKKAEALEYAENNNIPVRFFPGNLYVFIRDLY